MMKVSTVLSALLLALVGNAFAQTSTAAKDPSATPRIDQREANQEKRIEQGVESGQLTKREARRLHRGDQRIDNAEERAKADGVVSHKERKRLRHMQDAESKAIHHQKHDKQADLNHDGKRDRKTATP